MGIFGIQEMKDFAEEHEEPRVVAIWLRLEEARKKNAEWCDEAIRQRERVKRLEKELVRLLEFRDSIKEARRVFRHSEDIAESVGDALSELSKSEEDGR